MYYAFAIVKRVRAASRALSSAKWTPGSHACSYGARVTRVRVWPCEFCARRHAFTFPGGGNEEKRKREQSKTLGRRSQPIVAFPILFPPSSPASFSSRPFHFFSLSSFFRPSVPSPARAREFRKLEFEERGNAPVREEKRRCTREVSGFTATRTEFAGLSRLIRLGNSPSCEGIRKRAETAPPLSPPPPRNSWNFPPIRRWLPACADFDEGVDGFLRANTTNKLTVKFYSRITHDLIEAFTLTKNNIRTPSSSSSLTIEREETDQNDKSKLRTWRLKNNYSVRWRRASGLFER